VLQRLVVLAKRLSRLASPAHRTMLGADLPSADPFGWRVGNSPPRLRGLRASQARCPTNGSRRKARRAKTHGPAKQVGA
jgi:hypothetical protein